MNDFKLRRLKTGTLLFAIGCVVALLLDAAIDRHLDTEMEGIFGFYCLFGFFAIVVLVILSRVLRRIVAREEHFYGD
jgi:hypothetical protein